MSSISLSGFVNPFDELILNFHWYLYNLQPCVVVLWVGLAIEILNFAPKYGLAGKNMVRFDKKSVFYCPPRIHVPFR